VEAGRRGSTGEGEEEVLLVKKLGVAAMRRHMLRETSSASILPLFKERLAARCNQNTTLGECKVQHTR
jgi:hypothetical protein